MLENKFQNATDLRSFKAQALETSDKNLFIYKRLRAPVF